MSGSYDKLPARPVPPGGYPADPPDYYDDPVTGPATGPARSLTVNDPTERDPQGYTLYPETGAPRLESEHRPEVQETSRRRGKAQMNAPIVPAGSVTGRSLTLVIAIMCCLACLTAGAVYMINQSADAWLKDLASEVTVQVEPKDGVDTDKTVTDVADLLSKTRGVKAARPMALTDSAALLEPWLGKSDALKSLPVPRLIAIELDRGAGVDLVAVRKDLTEKFSGVSLDDHRQWQRQIRTVTRSLALGGIAILVLVAAATTAIIVSATQSSMASNREIVEVLHFVGATDRFIAREFEKHFLRLGIRAGCVGAALAGLVFLAMPLVMEVMGGGPVMMAEMHRLIGSGSLDTAGFVLLGIVVVIISALCMLTSRLGVFRILNAKR
jgi:cell division transport system permease protein